MTNAADVKKEKRTFGRCASFEILEGEFHGGDIPKKVDSAETHPKRTC